MFYVYLENNPKQIRALIGLRSARAVDIIMVRPKRIYILMVEVNKFISFLRRSIF